LDGISRLSNHSSEDYSTPLKSITRQQRFGISVHSPAALVLYDINSLFSIENSSQSGQVIRWNCSEHELTQYLLSKKLKLKKRGGLTLIDYWNKLLIHMRSFSRDLNDNYQPILGDTVNADKELVLKTLATHQHILKDPTLEGRI